MSPQPAIMMQKHRVSVVIPTLGGESLRGTIERLNAGSLVPEEILVCIPAKEAARAAALPASNVRVVATECRGQVPQRAAGFAQAVHEFVLQLDDDVLVDANCVEMLVSELSAVQARRAAIAPALKWTESGASVYPAAPQRPLASVFYWCVNGTAGYRSGTVTRAGTEIGVHCSESGGGAVEAEWLPGGCVLHRRRDLVLDNYFPFAGKAFCEDLIHSHHLRTRSVRLFVSRAATAYIERVPRVRSALRVHVHNLSAEIRARRYYVRLSSRSLPRMYLFYLAKLFGRVARYQL